VRLGGVGLVCSRAFVVVGASCCPQSRILSATTTPGEQRTWSGNKKIVCPPRTSFRNATNRCATSMLRNPQALPFLLRDAGLLSRPVKAQECW
jgi:hypothetical protein